MSDGSIHGDHVAAALAGVEALGELQGMLSNVHSKIEECIGLVGNATGDGTCSPDSGRNAFHFTIELLEMQEALYQHTFGASGELQRYAGGF